MRLGTTAGELAARWTIPTISKGVAGISILLMGVFIAWLPLTWATAGAIGATTLVLSLIRWEYALYLLILVIPLRPLQELTIGPLTITLTEAVVALLTLTWLVARLTDREIRLKFTPLFPPMVVVLGVFLLSTSLAPSLRLSLKETAKWLELMVVYLLVASTVKERRQFYTIIALMMVAGVVEALVGGYQFIRGVGPPSFILGGRFMRAHGTFGQPNPYAGYLGLSLALGGGILVATLSKRRSRSIIIIMAFSLAVLLLAVLLSLSRGAWLAISLAFIIILLIHNRQLLLGLLFGGLVVTLLLAVGLDEALPVPVIARLSLLKDYFGWFDVRGVFATSQNWAIVERMAYWQAAAEMFRDHPLLGVGIGNFGYFYPQYALPDWDIPAIHAHNYYLNLLAEVGVVGLAAYLGFLLTTFSYVGRSLRQAKARIQQQASSITDYAIILGVLGALVAISVHNLFDNLYVHGISAQVGMVLG
ncbi:MAG: O-antigen ligase family protein, partial [Chloroflexi bacterium]|nr:O-antigen ligase family protein [Chloroflexota bacterium]